MLNAEVDELTKLITPDTFQSLGLNALMVVERRGCTGRRAAILMHTEGLASIFSFFLSQCDCSAFHLRDFPKDLGDSMALRVRVLKRCQF